MTSVIPGARNPTQAHANSRAAALQPLPDTALRAVDELYDRKIRAQVHHLW